MSMLEIFPKELQELVFLYLFPEDLQIFHKEGKEKKEGEREEELILEIQHLLERKSFWKHRLDEFSLDSSEISQIENYRQNYYERYVGNYFRKEKYFEMGILFSPDINVYDDLDWNLDTHDEFFTGLVVGGHSIDQSLLDAKGSHWGHCIHFQAALHSGDQEKMKYHLEQLDSQNFEQDPDFEKSKKSLSELCKQKLIEIPTCGISFHSREMVDHLVELDSDMPKYILDGRCIFLLFNKRPKFLEYFLLTHGDKIPREVIAKTTESAKGVAKTMRNRLDYDRNDPLWRPPASNYIRMYKILNEYLAKRELS